MKKKIEFSNFGFSTILLCFVMICVVTFSALSLVSAYSDYKLSKKVADKNADYYKAQERAYETVALIDNLAMETYLATASSSDYYAAMQEKAAAYGTVTTVTDALMLSFTESIATDHTLCISLKICHPSESNESFVQIVEWKSHYDKAEPEDDYLDLIK